MKKKYFVFLSILLISFFSLSVVFSNQLSEKDLENVSFDDQESTSTNATINDEITSEKDQTTDNVDAKAEDTATEDQTTAEAKTTDADGWNLAELDTARDVNYLTEIEKDIIFETNKVRTDPAKYAKLYIQPTFKLYQGKYYNEPGEITLVTNEGVSAAKECYNVLLRQKPCAPLKPGKGLSRAAKEHATEQGKTSKTGHSGANGSTPFTRMKKYCSFGYAGENISYGCGTARSVIVQLIVDDGVSDRGHRKNTFQTNFTPVGVGTYSHKKYGYECVLDYAGNYQEKAN